MNFANQYRTHTSAEANESLVGQKVRFAGWVENIRDHGGVCFVDLRDQYGLVQVVMRDTSLLNGIGKEDCISVFGTMELRDEDTVNLKIESGTVELSAESVDMLGKVRERLPFEVPASKETREDIRLMYRYLDLRNRKVKEGILFRSRVIAYLRRRMEELGFTEIQTPILTSSSPEGARDYLVPSRKYKGKFYALPQAPQIYKQLLMVSGFDRYFQVAPCFRDEDARADRSPGEFYQLDFEMSFATQEDVFAVAEAVLTDTFARFAPEGYEVTKAPYPVISYKEAMLSFGTDKPDLRNPLRIIDVTEFFQGCTFRPFLKKTVRAIKVSQEMSKGFHEKLLAFALSGVYAIVDGFFVGQSVGDAGLSAINVAFPVVSLMQSLGTGIGMGGAVLWSVRRSADESAAARYVRATLWLLLFASAAMTPCFLLAAPVMRLFGAEGAVYTYGVDYLNVIVLGAVFQIFATGAVPLIRNAGGTVFAFLTMVSGFLTNILLDYVFVWVLNAGTTGAAIATVIGQAVTAAEAVGYLLYKKLPFFGSLRGFGRCAASIARVGIAPFGLTLSPMLSLMLINRFCMFYDGQPAVACYACIAYAITIVQMLLQGVGDGSQPLISRFYGEGNRHVSPHHRQPHNPMGNPSCPALLPASLLFARLYRPPVRLVGERQHGRRGGASDLLDRAALLRLFAHRDGGVLRDGKDGILLPVRLLRARAHARAALCPPPLLGAGGRLVERRARANFDRGHRPHFAAAVKGARRVRARRGRPPRDAADPSRAQAGGGPHPLRGLRRGRRLRGRRRGHGRLR